MRSENEKKSVTKSVKLSPLQVQQIEEKAVEKHMTFSGYMVDCAVHGNDGATPNIAVKVQVLANIIKSIADDLDRNQYISREELRQKADDLTEFFGSVSPQEKLNRLENNMRLFIEGGYDIWESLK